MDAAAPSSDPNDELRRYMDFARAVAARIVGASAADDVAQEVGWSIFRSPPKDMGPGFASWIRTVARRRALKDRSSNEKRALREIVVARDRAEAVDGLADVRKSEAAAAAVHDALAQLHEPDRLALTSKHLHGMSVSEFAQAAGISYEAASKRLKRAESRLRRVLEKRYGGPEALLAAMLPLSAVGRGHAAAASLTKSVAPSAKLTAAASGVLWAALMTKKPLLAAAVLALLGYLVAALFRPTADAPAPYRGPFGAEAAFDPMVRNRPTADQAAKAAFAVAFAPFAEPAVELPPAAPGSLKILALREGRPLADTPLTLTPLFGNNPFLRRVRLRSDAAGQAAIPALPPGTYRIDSDLGPTSTATVRSEAASEAEIRIDGGHRVDVVVEDRNRNVAPIADVHVVPDADCNGAGQRGHTSPSYRTDSSGRLRIDGVAKDFRIWATAPGYAPSPTRQVGGSTPPTAPVYLRLGNEGASISGVCRDAAGAAVKGALIRMYSEIRWEAEEERQWDSCSGWQRAPAPDATSDENGRFRLDGIARGEWTLSALAADMYCIRQVTIDGSGETALVEITFGTTCVVTGRVTDSHGLAVPAVHIELHPESIAMGQAVENALGGSGDKAFPFSATCDSLGMFRVAGLPNGTYVAKASATSGHGSRQFVVDGTITHIDASLQMSDKETVRVRVEAGDDRTSENPQAGVELQMFRAGIESVWSSCTTDTDGNAFRHACGAEPLEVRLDRKALADRGYRFDADPVVAVPGGPTVVMRLRRGSLPSTRCDVSGRLVRTDGSPVDGVEVCASGTIDYARATTSSTGRFVLRLDRLAFVELSVIGPQPWSVGGWTDGTRLLGSITVPDSATMVLPEFKLEASGTLVIRAPTGDYAVNPFLSGLSIERESGDPRADVGSGEVALFVDGVATVVLGPGRYRVVTRRFGHGIPDGSRLVTVQSGEATNLDLVPNDIERVLIRGLLPEGAASEGAATVIGFDGVRLDCNLSDITDWSYLDGALHSTRPGEMVADLRPGTYRIEVEHRGIRRSGTFEVLRSGESNPDDLGMWRAPPTALVAVKFDELK